MQEKTDILQNTHLEWQAPSHENYQRSSQWYLVAGVATLTIIVYGVLTGAWSMSLAVSLAGGLFFLVRNEKHQNKTIAIRSDGIVWEGAFIPWGECTGFWIVQAPTYYELHVSRRGLRPDVVVQTGSQDPYAVRDLLSQYLPQKENQGEKIFDTISRFCKL